MSKKLSAELAALRDASIEDIMALTDNEILALARENGEDVGAVANSLRTMMRETASAAIRKRVASRKFPANSSQGGANRPSIEQIKQVVIDLFRNDQKLALAFRDGKKQTDEDWQSLYDDLVLLGAIPSK